MALQPSQLAQGYCQLDGVHKVRGRKRHSLTLSMKTLFLHGMLPVDFAILMRHVKEKYFIQQ